MRATRVGTRCSVRHLGHQGATEEAFLVYKHDLCSSEKMWTGRYKQEP